MFYFNVDHVRDVILDRARGATPLPKLVVLDLSASPYVDLQSAQTLAGLAGELAAGGISMQTVEAHASVRDRLRREGVDGKIHLAQRVTSVADVVDAFGREGPDRAQMSGSV